MTLPEILAALSIEFPTLNPPASPQDLAALHALIPNLPPDLVALYRHHDGSNSLLKSADRRLTARLMPISHVLKSYAVFVSIPQLPRLGTVLPLFTDDNSNNILLYTDGPAAGFLTVFDHEEQSLVPAFRSSISVLSNLLAQAYRKSPRSGAADIPSLRRDLPETVSNPATLSADRQLTAHFLALYRLETDKDLRRLYARSTMCLTPVEDTAQLLPFLLNPDMWTPESAVCLFELRRYHEAIDALETLARDGGTNGDSAAMRLLVRIGNDLSRAALDRLRNSLQGQKLSCLNLWTNRRFPLQPPRWP